MSVFQQSLFVSVGFGEQVFGGFQNFVALFNDPVFVTSFWNSLKLLVTVPITTFLALLIALMLFEGTRGWKVYRVLVFLPYLIPATAIGISFSYLLQKNGVLNTILESVGLKFLALDWVGNPDLVLGSIGGVIVWSQLGFGVIVFTAALMGVPSEIVEAARVDGASRWQRNRMIVVPSIRGTIEFFLAIQAIQVLAWTFTYVYVISLGGPGSASSVMDLYIWRYAFQYNSTGLSSAAAVVLLGISSILIVAYARSRRRQQDGES